MDVTLVMPIQSDQHVIFRQENDENTKDFVSDNI